MVLLAGTLISKRPSALVTVPLPVAFHCYSYTRQQLVTGASDSTAYTLHPDGAPAANIQRNTINRADVLAVCTERIHILSAFRPGAVLPLCSRDSKLLISDLFEVKTIGFDHGHERMRE